MLSEQRENRIRRIWSDFSVNPRGELWKKDKQNIGCKLLKKMGWKKDTGLGKNGNGITAPIPVVQTYDKEGLGFSKQVSDYSWNWLSHQDDYTSLLRQLREQHWAGTDSSACADQNSSVDNHHMSDLRRKIKVSRKRERYQRTIEGKKMANRSEAEWQCILGKKTVEHTSEETEMSNGTDKNQELLVTSTVDLHSYFLEKKLKLEAMHSTKGDIKLPDQREENGVREDSSSVCRNSEEDKDESDTSHSPVHRNKRKRKKRTKEKGKQRKLERKLARQQKKKENKDILNSLSNSKSSESFGPKIDYEVGSAPINCSSSSKASSADSQTESCSKSDGGVGEQRLNTRWRTSYMGNKTATKYQCFLECIRHDPVFQTSNLLSIKGYGNS